MMGINIQSSPTYFAPHGSLINYISPLHHSSSHNNYFSEQHIAHTRFKEPEASNAERKMAYSSATNPDMEMTRTNRDDKVINHFEYESSSENSFEIITHHNTEVPDVPSKTSSGGDDEDDNDEYPLEKLYTLARHDDLTGEDTCETTFYPCSEIAKRNFPPSWLLLPNKVEADGTKLLTLGEHDKPRNDPLSTLLQPNKIDTDRTKCQTLGDHSGTDESPPSMAFSPHGTRCDKDKPYYAPNSTYDGSGPNELYYGGPFATGLYLNKVDADGTKWYTVFETKNLDFDFQEYGIKQDSMMYALMQAARDSPLRTGIFSLPHTRPLVLSSRFEAHRGCFFEASFFNDSRSFRLSIAQGSYMGLGSNGKGTHAHYPSLNRLPSPLRNEESSSSSEFSPNTTRAVASPSLPQAQVPTLDSFTYVPPPMAPKFPWPHASSWTSQSLTRDLQQIPELEDK
jgi:hypothetical protein